MLWGVNEEADAADTLNKAMAAELRAERAVTGKTFAAIEAGTGIPERTLMRIFKGERDLRASHLILLTAALDITPADFIARAEKRAANGK
jgi:transcriptional regulator with XRE-family HTH domain